MSLPITKLDIEAASLIKLFQAALEVAQSSKALPDSSIRSPASRCLKCGIEQLQVRCAEQQGTSISSDDVLFTYDDFCKSSNTFPGARRFQTGVHQTSLHTLKKRCQELQGDFLLTVGKKQYYVAMVVIETATRESNPAVGLRWIDCSRSQIASRTSKPSGRVDSGTTKEIAMRRLYTLVGLWPEEPTGGGDNTQYQDFQTRSGPFNNPIAYLWSSPGSKIWTVVEPGSNGAILQIHFEYNGEGGPPNVAIHPTGLVALKRPGRQRYLAFEARAGGESKATDSMNAHGELAVAVRVRDAELIQWEFRKGDNYLLPPVVGTKWKPYNLDLAPDDRTPLWHEFLPLGMASKNRPDFGVITSVVFEVGRALAGHRPGRGKGVIEVRNIRLSSKRLTKRLRDTE